MAKRRRETFTDKLEKLTGVARENALIELASRTGMSLITPLNSGLHVYFRDPVSNKLLHRKIDDPELSDKIVSYAQRGLKNLLVKDLENMVKTSKYPEGAQNLLNRINEE